jgi:hypothetical protein
MPTPEQVRQAEEQIVQESKRIDFYVAEYTIELLAAKMGRGEFEIPAYQRNFTWEDQRKTRFIESIIMGLPIPFLVFWEIPETGKLEVVDGSQRLRTITAFLANEIELGEMEALTELQGSRFGDLLESRQRKLKNRTIRAIILNEHADEKARFELFDRVNTSSKIANNAEVRRGAIVGPFLDLVISLANDPVFTDLAPISPTDNLLREREELVTRFFAYGDGLADYRDRVGDFLFDYAKKMTRVFGADPEGARAYRDRFANTMNFVKRWFPCGFRKSPQATTTPRARFEAIAVGSFRALLESPTLEPGDPQSWLESEEFRRVTTSDSANAKKRLEARIDLVRRKLLGDDH